MISHVKIIVVSFFLISSVWAEEIQKKVIPEPLQLSDALSFSEESHPYLSTANFNIQAALNTKDDAESQNNINAFLEGRLRYIEPSDISADKSNDDHRAGIIVSKTLYDFGRTDASIRSAEQNIKTHALNKTRVVLERRLDIMTKFFDVILADMNFYRYNEEMATAFISLDRLKDRLKLGQRSDVDVMKQDVEYNRVRYLRIKSQNEQRKTRAKLAVALGRPGELSATISKPVLKKINSKLPEVEVLQKLALDNNYLLKSLNSKLLTARTNIELARNSDSPTLSLEAGSYAYSRERSSHDELQVGVVLRVPIFGGRRSDIKIAQALNKVHLIEADIALAKTKLSADILTQWLEYDSLRGKLLQMKALTDYRELYLDRSRALYEMEVKTDLGDAMVRVSEAEREYLQTQYQMMLALTKLELELGVQLDDFLKISTNSKNNIGTSSLTKKENK